MPVAILVVGIIKANVTFFKRPDKRKIWTPFKGLVLGQIFRESKLRVLLTWV